MKTPQVLSLISGLAVCLGASVMLPAQEPGGLIVTPVFSSVGEGVYVMELGSVREELVDKYGDYYEVELRFGPATADAAGKISSRGTTEAWVWYEGDFVFAEPTGPGLYSLTGKLGSSRGKATFSAKLTGSGEFTAYDQRSKGKLSLNYKGTLDPASETEAFVSGNRSGSGSLSGLGSAKIAEPFFDEVPEGVFRYLGWRLEMTLTTSRGKITGQAAVQLDDGPAYPCTVKGSYASKTGMSKLTLTGTGVGKGVKLTVNLQGNAVTRITGTLVGQKVDVTP